MPERIEGLNKICGREECLVTDPFLCWGCFGDELQDDQYDY
jgi:hypothetical protein